MVEHRWITDINDFRVISLSWDEALINSGNPNPFLLSDFILNWCRQFAGEVKPAIFTVYKDNRLVAGLPLCLKKRYSLSAFAKILFYIGGSAANYTEPFCADFSIDIISLLMMGLEEGGYDGVCLSDIRMENKIIFQARDTFNNKNYLISLVSDHLNWGIDLSAGADNYFSLLSKKLMKDLRAKRKYAEARYGAIGLKGIRGEEEVKRYFDIYLDFSRSAFRQRKRRSAFEEKRYTDFFKDFLVAMENKNRLDCHGLFSGEKLLAVSFGYNFGPGFNWILTAFDYNYKYIRPGYLLIEELIKEISRRKEKFYNWYGHARFYKTQWCNVSSPLYRLILVRRNLRGIVYFMASKIEQMIRANKILVNVARMIKRS